MPNICGLWLGGSLDILGPDEKNLQPAFSTMNQTGFFPVVHMIYTRYLDRYVWVDFIPRYPEFIFQS